MGYRYDCSKCKIRCDGKSLGVYNFKNDVEYSEHFENEIISKLCKKSCYAKKTEKDGYPDIDVYISKNGALKCYIEVKAQRRTFMSVEKILPNSDLIPSETMALNLSDLLRYFDIAKRETVPIYILWVLSNRPCAVDNDKVKYFYQKIDILERIYNKYRNTRTFRRKSGVGDVVNGEHKGVVVNYHFSLSELKEIKI